MIRILFVCHGNICRSTMAQCFFAWLCAENGLSEFFEIDSAATSREEIGNGPHRGTVKTLKKYNIPLIPHTARQMTLSDAAYYDLLIGMDDENMWGMKRITKGKYTSKMHKLLEFTAQGTLKSARDVDDPWYSGNFEQTYADVSSGCANLLEYCIKNYGILHADA